MNGRFSELCTATGTASAHDGGPGPYLFHPEITLPVIALFPSYVSASHRSHCCAVDSMFSCIKAIMYGEHVAHRKARHFLWRVFETIRCRKVYCPLPNLILDAQIVVDGTYFFHPPRISPRKNGSTGMSTTTIYFFFWAVRSSPFQSNGKSLVIDPWSTY